MPKSSKKHELSTCKFHINIQLKKIDLNLNFPCRVSVIFKRDYIKQETNNAVLLENGQACFDEALSMMCIFNFDSKKKIFLEKETSLIFQTISNKNIKIAGITKLYLTEYININAFEKDIILPIRKCIDKEAKVYFGLEIKLLEDKRIDIQNSTEEIDLNNMQESLDFCLQTLNNKPNKFLSPLPYFEYFSTCSTKFPDDNISEYKKSIKQSFYRNSRGSKDYDSWKYKPKIGEHHRSLTANNIIMESMSKTRDTSLDHNTSKSYIKTPIKTPNKINNSKDFSINTSKSYIEMKKSIDSENMKTLPIRLTEPDDHFDTINKVQYEIDNNNYKNKEYYHRMETQYNDMQRELENVKKIHEKLKIEQLSWGDKRIELELRLYKEKVSSLMRINEQLKNDLMLSEKSFQELQNINEQLLTKLEGLDETEKFNNTNILNGKIYCDILRKVNILETSNESLQEMIAYTNFENERLKRKNTELTFELNNKELKLTQDEKEVQVDSDLENLNESNITERTPGFKTTNDNITQKRNKWKMRWKKKELQQARDDAQNLELYRKKNQKLQKEIELLRISLNEKESLINELKSIKKEQKSFQLDEKITNWIDSSIQPQKNNQLFKINGEDEQLQRQEEAKITEKELELVLKCDELKKELSDAYANMKLMEEKFENLNQIIDENTNEVIVLQQEIAHKSDIIQSLKNTQKLFQGEDKVENEKLKLELNSIEKEKDDLRIEYEKKLAILNDNINSLKEENHNLIQDIESIKSNTDSKIMLMQIENDRLNRYVNELKNALKECQCNHTDKIDLRNQVQKLISTLTKTQEDVQLLKHALSQAEKDKEVLRSIIIGHEDKVREMNEIIEKLESNAWKSKHKLAKMLNIAFEYGGAEFMENIEQLLCSDDDEISNF